MSFKIICNQTFSHIRSCHIHLYIVIHIHRMHKHNLIHTFTHIVIVHCAKESTRGNKDSSCMHCMFMPKNVIVERVCVCVRLYLERERDTYTLTHTHALWCICIYIQLPTLRLVHLCTCLAVANHVVIGRLDRN